MGRRGIPGPSLIRRGRAVPAPGAGCKMSRSIGTNALDMPTLPDSQPKERRWPEGGITRIPFWVYTDPEIYRLEQERVFGGIVLELRGAGGGNSRSRRLQALLRRRTARGGHPRSGRRRQRGGQPLRPPGCPVLHGPAGQRQRVHVPLPPVGLRPQGQPDRGSLPPGTERPGRHAGRLRIRRPWPANPERGRAQRRRLRLLRLGHGILRGLPRPRHARLSTGSSTAARSGFSVISASASRPTGSSCSKTSRTPTTPA